MADDPQLEYTLSNEFNVSPDRISGEVTHIDITKTQGEMDCDPEPVEVFIETTSVVAPPVVQPIPYTVATTPVVATPIPAVAPSATKVHVVGTGGALSPPTTTTDFHGSYDSMISKVHVDGPGGYYPAVSAPRPAPIPYNPGSLTTAAQEPPAPAMMEECNVHGMWSGRFDFFFSALGYVVTFANIWMFPYLCAKHGGIAFLIPYILMWAFLGIPVFYLETALGQYVGKGPLNSWGCVPIFAGIGVAMVFAAVILTIYFNVIVGYAVFYMVSAFTDVLPWMSCGGEWSNKNCYYNMPDVACNDPSRLVQNANGQCVDKTLNNTVIGVWNNAIAMQNGIVREPAALQYFKYYVLGVSEGVDDVGILRWQIVLCMLVVWLFVFLCLIRNQRSHGKVVYFTSLIPYGLLTALLIRACTLDGYLDGVNYYINPRWETLGTLEAWVDAGHIVFFSLLLGYGGLIALSSYNKFNKIFVREVFFIGVLHTLTSLFAGFVIFAYIGVYARMMNKSVADCMEHSYSLGFVLIPEILAKVPVAPLWVVFFMLLLIFVGIDTQLAMLQIMITGFIDTVPQWFRKGGKTILIMILCIIFAIIGLVICARGGFYVMLLMESRIATWAMLVVALCECVAVGWVYGWDNISRDIESMVGYSPFIFWRICWQFVSPAIILFLLIGYWVRAPLLYWTSMGVFRYDFPEWANIVCWMLAVAVVVCIPVSALIVLCMARGTCNNRVADTIKPTTDWGPSRNSYKAFSDISSNAAPNGWKASNMANPAYASYGRRASKGSLGATLIHVPGYYDSNPKVKDRIHGEEDFEGRRRHEPTYTSPRRHSTITQEEDRTFVSTINI